MIYLHKIIPFLLMPSTVAVLLIVAGWFLKRKGMAVAGACVLLIFSMPITAGVLFRFLEAGEERIPASEAPSADAIVVLSGAGVMETGKSKVVEWNDPDRYFGGVQLYFSGKAPLILFTGGWLPWTASARPEGEILVEQACLMGVPPSSLMTTRKVSNTEQEAIAVAQILRDRRKDSPGALGASPRIILVTSAYHMPRARMLFEKAGLEVVPYPVDFKTTTATTLSFLKFLPNASALDASETAVRELYGRIYYRLKP